MYFGKKRNVTYLFCPSNQNDEIFGFPNFRNLCLTFLPHSFFSSYNTLHTLPKSQPLQFRSQDHNPSQTYQPFSFNRSSFFSDQAEARESFFSEVTMQNQNDMLKDEAEVAASISAIKVEEWGSCSVEDVMDQPSFQEEEEASKVPYVGDKEPLSSLAEEYQSGSPILLEKIKILDNQYIGIRRTRGDGNCFFRSFMFSYLEHILESQDRAEVDRIKVNVEKCRKTLQNLGYTDFTFEDFFALFLEQLDDLLQGSGESISYDELVNRSRDQSVSDYIVMFFRFVTAGDIRTRADFFEPFITGLSNTTVDQFCKSSVEPMGEESDHIHITALSDVLGVAIRVVYLDRSSCDNGGVTVNHHDFVPVGTNEKEEASAPFITLLYRPGHYDILYPKSSCKVSDNVAK